ncbi:DUF2797 domain-containing protein [Streptomyces sp. NPDC048717]|uniref:DUF2797 domain-containing protein n=1 Tax=Streptomyces sp. NPDC048717 TaxID=3154928 RepID=UPI00342E3BA1
MVVWRSAGVSWRDGRPALRWEGRGGRVSALAYGQDLAFRALGERHCSGARGNPCPLAATVPGPATGGRCPSCARLDRAHSVAADTLADDRRPYRVYLAWFGPGMVKVGITGEARGATRLLEQGAIAFSWLGRGPLMAARRTEEVLRHALGVPDRIPYARKRAARYALPPAPERAREVEELYERARGVPAWSETLEALPCEVHDHAETFALAALGPTAPTAPTAPGPATPPGTATPPGHATGPASPPGPHTPPRTHDPYGLAVTELVDGGVVSGRLLAAAGPDLHLSDREGRALVLDTRLLTGWELAAAPAGHPVTVPLAAPPPPAEGKGARGGQGAPQEPLF